MKINNINDFKLSFCFFLTSLAGVLFLLNNNEIGYFFIIISGLFLLLLFIKSFYDFNSKRLIKPKLKTLIFIDFIIFISNINGASYFLLTTAIILLIIITLCFVLNILNYIKNDF